MKFYDLNTLGKPAREIICVLDDHPDGMGMKDYCLSVGKPIADVFASSSKTISMTQDQPGTVITDIVSNTLSCLMVTEKLKKLIQSNCDDLDIEYLRFSLLDHDGHFVRDDLFYINPISYYDALNIDASGVKYRKNGKPRRVDQVVLDSKKISEAPMLFRAPESRKTYIVREDLLLLMREAGIENIDVEELPII